MLFYSSTDGVRKAEIELQKIVAETPARVAEAKVAEEKAKARQAEAKAKETQAIQETERLRLRLQHGAQLTEDNEGEYVFCPSLLLF